MDVPFASADAVRGDVLVEHIRDQAGGVIAAPVTADDDFPYFTASQGPGIRSYYRENGYVVVRNVIPAECCAAVNRLFETEVKPWDGYMYRGRTAVPQRHAFNLQGFMLNPILDIQSLEAQRFGGFRDAGLAVMTHSAIRTLVHELLGERGKLVRSMYFEGSPATWAHQDTYYLDSEHIGCMVGAWIALEDIAPGAGRFFVYPQSHLMALQRNGGEIDVARDESRYRELVVDLICLRRLECRAPALRCGDVLLWSSKTMHGSLNTTGSQFSRRSLTAHYIPESSRLLRFQSRICKPGAETINGMQVHKPNNPNGCSRRLALWLGKCVPRFPRTG